MKKNKKILSASIERIIILLILSISTPTLIWAQNKEVAKFESLIRLGDAQFDISNYLNAADFYSRAYNIDSSSAHVNFSLGECYRSVFEYAKAKKYYYSASNKDIAAYPLSHFYYALMLKYEGKYDMAIAEFQKFIERTTNISPSTFKQKKAFFQRALIEMEGCYWALEQLGDNKPVILPNPVNTKFNDFAPIIYKNDSDIVIVSGRTDSKFDVRNSLGESYTNFYRFQKTSKGWVEAELDNKLSKMNSKFNEGAGVFNSDFTKYYFTSCGREDSYCKIYITEYKSDKWTDAKLLNESINAQNADNKQPALSANGDTLYFVSNRAGGYGQNDIWFSVLNGDNENWSDAQNIGSEINTPFNETSPFYYAKENVLFFSSEGLKGFGGLDVFIARKELDGNFGVTNISTPYNSNADDCYFALGNKKGYIVSNRLGGVGEFDIYSFENMFNKTQSDYKQKLAKLSAELSKLKYDVEINKPDIPTEIVSVDLQNIYDRIVSAKKAALIYDVVLIFNETDYNDFNKLTLDDKSIIDYMYMAFEVSIKQKDIDSIKKADKALYERIAVDEVAFIDRMAEAYTNTSGGAGFVKMKDFDKEFYSKIKIHDKELCDRLIAYKIYTGKLKKNIQIVDILNQNKIGLTSDSAKMIQTVAHDDYERLISARLAGFIYDIDFRFTKSDYDIFKKLSDEESSLLDMDFKSRAFELKKDFIDSIHNQDYSRYFQLSRSEQTTIENIALAYHNAPISEDFVKLKDVDQQFLAYAKLDDKRRFDRLIASHLHSMMIDSIANMKRSVKSILPEIDTMVVNAQKQNEYQRLISSKIAGYIYEVHFPYVEADFQLFESMNSDDKGFIDMLYTVQSKEFTPKIVNAIKNDDKIAYSQLNQSDKKLIDRIAYAYEQTSYDSLYVTLRDDEKAYYSKLNLDDKKKIDRYIAYSLSEIKRTKQDAIMKYVDISTDEMGINDEMKDKLFTSIELSQIERLLSFRIASYIHNLNVPFTDADYKTYNNLSIENLSVLDMMFTTKTFSLQDADDLNAVRTSDENQYKKLVRTEKNLVDRIAQAYLFIDENTTFVKLSTEDSLKYVNLSLIDKYKTDRLVLYKIRQLIAPAPTVISTEGYLNGDLMHVENLSKQTKLITPEEYLNFERIASVRIASIIHNRELPYIESDYAFYSTMGLDEISIIEMMVDTKKLGLRNPLIVDSLRDLDESRYKKLTSDNRTFIDRIVECYSKTPFGTDFVKIGTFDSLLYAKLSIKDKYETDRLIAYKLKTYKEAAIVKENLINTLKKDEFSINEIDALVPKEENDSYGRILSFQMAAHIYNVDLPLNSIDYELYEKLSMEERSLLDMMLKIKTASMNDSLSRDSVIRSDKVSYENATDDEKQFIDRIVKKYTALNELDKNVKFDDADVERYKKQTVDEKFVTDRLVIAKLAKILDERKKTAEAESKLTSNELTESMKEMIEDNTLVSQTDYLAYEKIVSFKLASYINGIKVAFLSPDYQSLSKLSDDDKSIMDMMYESRIQTLKDTAIVRLLQQNDDVEFKNLPENEKTFVNRIVTAYTTNTNVDYVALSASDSVYYCSLPIEKKNKTDRMIVSRLRNLTKPLNTKNALQTSNVDAPMSMVLINEEDYDIYERLASMKLANYIYGTRVPFIESDAKLAKKNSIDDISLIDMMYLTRIYNITDETINSLKNADVFIYNSLSDVEKKFVDRIAENCKSQINNKFVTLNSEDAATYSKLNLIEKNKFDRLIIAKVGITFIPPKVNDANNLKAVSFSLESANCITIDVTAVLKASSGEVSKTKLILKDENDKTLVNSMTDQTGRFQLFKIPANKKYKILIDKPQTEDAVYSISDLSIVCKDEGKVQGDKIIVKEVLRDTTGMFSFYRPVENLYFEFSQFQINDYSKFILDRIVQSCNICQDCPIYLNAYADDIGTDETNQRLSQQRGDMVASFLVAAGVDKRRITVNPRGKQSPVAPNNAEQSRKLNRRVEVVLVGKN